MKAALLPMSALGQKQYEQTMSALPPKADMLSAIGMAVDRHLLDRLAVDLENFDWPPRRAVVKDGNCKAPGVPRTRIKVSPILLEDRPMCMLMVPVHDMALAMAAVVIVSIDFPYDVFGILLIQRTIWINARVYENAMRIDVHER
jgi:hypothetical protein